MKTLTFTQKLLRQSRLFSALLPMFALFVGLGFTQSAQAGIVGPNGSTLYVDQSGTGSGPNTTYPAPAFDGTNLGTYDINVGQLLLNGGTFTTTETDDATYTYSVASAVIDFSVFPSNTTQTALQTITLTQTSVTTNPSTGARTRTFSLTNAQQNLIRQAAVTAAGNYSVYTQFRATGVRTNRSTGAVQGINLRDDNSGLGYVADFSVTGTAIPATNIGNSNVFINVTGTTTPNVTYGASSTTTPRFQGANLGSYDVNTGTLTLNGGNVTTFESGGDVVQNARLIYQIVKPAQNGQAPILFPASNIALVQNSATTDANGNTTRTFSNNTALRNLINGLANSGIGNFNLIVRFESDVINAAGSLVQVQDNNGGAGYVATFSTTGVPILTDTWTGNVNDDWFNPANWDLNRIPDATTNAIVPDFGTGSTKPYPNINAGVTFTTSNGTTANNTASGPAMTRDLLLRGSSQAQRTILRLIAGRLRVFGDFTNLQDSFIQRQGSVFELSGVNQTFTGGSNFDAVEISGGGVKTLTGTMYIGGSLTFLPNGGVITTDVSRVNTNFIDFGDRSATSPNGAQLIGETEVAYIRGFVRTNRANVLANEVDANGNPDPRTFGNLGMTLFFKGANNPGDVLVTRNTAESYTPLTTTSQGTTARYGIRRIFGVRPGSPNTNNGGLVADLTFHYRDAELVNLGPTGTGSVAEPNLALFVSTSGGNQFGFLGVDALDQVNNILTKNNVRTFATFTLGDRFAPLPVTLTGFDAKRVGNDALITWQTASEQNSRGYEVQVSTNGETFRTLGFVASEAPNSVRPLSYSYVDVERNKAGQRYYRLRQIDVDGKDTFFAPRVVNFEGKATETAMTAYPNPFGNSDNLHLSLQSATAGDGMVQIIDMTGRVVSQEKVDITTGNNEVTLSRLGDLKGGLYQVHFVLPSGQVQNLKVMKQ